MPIFCLFHTMPSNIYLYIFRTLKGCCRVRQVILNYLCHERVFQVASFNIIRG